MVFLPSGEVLEFFPTFVGFSTRCRAHSIKGQDSDCSTLKLQAKFKGNQFNELKWFFSHPRATWHTDTDSRRNNLFSQKMSVANRLFACKHRILHLFFCSKMDPRKKIAGGQRLIVGQRSLSLSPSERRARAKACAPVRRVHWEPCICVWHFSPLCIGFRLFNFLSKIYSCWRWEIDYWHEPCSQPMAHGSCIFD